MTGKNDMSEDGVTVKQPGENSWSAIFGRVWAFWGILSFIITFMVITRTWRPADLYWYCKNMDACLAYDCWMSFISKGTRKLSKGENICRCF